MAKELMTLELVSKTENGMAKFKTEPANFQNLLVVCESALPGGYASGAYSYIDPDGEAIVSFQLNAHVEAFITRRSNLDKPLSNTVTFDS